ncbi:hypothetical protein EVAR_96496_1 [Eumeta japonica]|uniref:Uncharacterized protein n=1 Tax=Eumeta variegata TaxID=151549 RepID=A0A4C1ZS24_EUMVA|nr:hypothetical protein EVAR_96496_1 [Eumeta japonica]
MMSRDLYNSRFDESPRGGVAGASAMTIIFLFVIGGDTPTYTKGDASFIVDLTFVTANLIRGISYWKVMDSYTASDCNAILWEIPNDRNPRRRKRQSNTVRRNDQEPDEKNYPGQRCEYEPETWHEPEPCSTLMERTNQCSA